MTMRCTRDPFSGGFRCCAFLHGPGGHGRYSTEILMASSRTNQYHSTDPSQPRGKASSRWLNWLASGACAYYILSAVTLPFANKAWIGEIPVFGFLQGPKAFIKSGIHDALLHAVNRFGWSTGSASPDYGMTHPWAMIFMTAIPALVLILILLRFGAGRTRAVILFVVITCAAIDAVVTLSFDAASSLKLYNGSFL